MTEPVQTSDCRRSRSGRCRLFLPSFPGFPRASGDRGGPAKLEPVSEDGESPQSQVAARPAALSSGAQAFRRPVPLRQPLAVPRPLPGAGAASRAAAASQLCPAAEPGSTASFRAAALAVTVSFVACLLQNRRSLLPSPLQTHLSVIPPFYSPPSLPSLLLFFRSNNCYFCCRGRDCAGFFSFFPTSSAFFEKKKIERFLS